MDNVIGIRKWGWLTNIDRNSLKWVVKITHKEISTLNNINVQAFARWTKYLSKENV